MRAADLNTASDVQDAESFSSGLNPCREEGDDVLRNDLSAEENTHRRYAQDSRHGRALSRRLCGSHGGAYLDGGRSQLWVGRRDHGSVLLDPAFACSRALDRAPLRFKMG